MRIKRLQKTPRSLSCAGTRLEYHCAVSSRRRTVSIEVDTDASVCVYAPRSITHAEVENFIREKFEWILDKKNHMHRQKEMKQRRIDASKGTVLFLGKRYALVTQTTQSTRPRLIFNGSEFSLFMPDVLSPQDCARIATEHLIRWYRREAKEILGARLFHYTRIMKMGPQKITVREQKRIWGSCYHSTQSINLNWRLVMAPIDVIDYVIVHELSHLAVANHSRRFWNKVEKILPDYQRRQRWLKEHAVHMECV